MKPSTRTIKYLKARTLVKQWALLSKPRKKYAAHLVRRYAYPVRLAVQQAYIWGYNPYPYDHRAKAATTETDAPKSFTRL